MACPRHKRRFTEYADAVAAANRSLDNDGDRVRNVGAYSCHWCGGYHLSSGALPQIDPGSKKIRRGGRANRPTSKKRRKRDRKSS